MTTNEAILKGLCRADTEVTDAENQKWLEENGFKPLFETQQTWVASRNEMDFLLNTWIKELDRHWKLVATLKDGKWSVAMRNAFVGRWLDMTAFTARSPRAENAANMALALFKEFLKELDGEI